MRCKSRSQEASQEAFIQEVTRILGDKNTLLDKWNKTAELLRKTAETVLGVIFGKRNGDRETWWLNEKVYESIKEKKEAKKAWDKIRNKNTKKMYKENKNKAKQAVAMAKGRAYDDLYADWKQKKVKRNYTDWLGRETERGKMYRT